MLLAAALTSCAVAAISAPIWQIIRAARDASVLSPSEPHEVVVFVAPVARTPVTSPAKRSSQSLTDTRRTPVPARIPPPTLAPATTTLDESSIPPSDSAAAEVPSNAGPAVPNQPINAPSPRARVVMGPVFSPSAYRGTSRLGGAEVQSVLLALGWRPVPPTQAEKDEAQRAQAASYARARDEHRLAPVAITGAGMSLPFPLFSSGPSRKQRTRDSVVHQGNLERLRGLEERAMRRRDSIRVADSTRLAKSATPSLNP